MASCEGMPIFGSCAGGSGSVRRPATNGWALAAGGRSELQELSRRPLSSPRRSNAAIEAAVLAVRAEEPTWGGRKISRRLKDLGHEPGPGALDGDGDPASGMASNWAPSAAARSRFTRFERARPNELWQMDFKGHVPLRGRPAASAHRAGRSFALCGRACGLRQRAHRDCQSAADHGLPALWPARDDHHRQRLAVGRRTRQSATRPSVCG